MIKFFFPHNVKQNVITAFYIAKEKIHLELVGNNLKVNAIVQNAFLQNELYLKK